jgi:hypothetical protein
MDFDLYCWDRGAIQRWNPRISRGIIAVRVYLAVYTYYSQDKGQVRSKRKTKQNKRWKPPGYSNRLRSTVKGGQTEQVHNFSGKANAISVNRGWNGQKNGRLQV